MEKMTTKNLFWICIFFLIVPFVFSTGEDYSISGSEDFLISNYDNLSPKRQTNFYISDKDWRNVVNNEPPTVDLWSNPFFAATSYKCLSYAASYVNDWANLEYGLPMKLYVNYLNGNEERGTNPRLLEQMYFDRGWMFTVVQFRGWPYYNYYFVPEIAAFYKLLRTHCFSEDDSVQDCDKFGELSAKDPITKEFIPYNLKGYAKILTDPINYIDKDDYNLPSIFTYNTDLDFFNYGDYIYYDSGMIRNSEDIEKLKILLEKNGPLLSFTENPGENLNIHAMAIIGHNTIDNQTYFIAHDNYGTDSSQYIKLIIDEIDHVFAFTPNEDWPTYRHDNRRTGFTLLKGDMEQSKTINYGNRALGISDTHLFARPSIGQVIGTDRPEIVTAVGLDENLYLTVTTRVVTEENGEIVAEYKADLDEYTSLPPSIGDVNGDGQHD